MAGAWSEAVGSQYDAALAMLANAIEACPEAAWAEGPPEFMFSYTAYHTLFWTDFYLFGSSEGFTPPEPFTLDEMDPAGIYPAEPHGKAVLLSYVAHCRARVRSTFAALTDSAAREPGANERLGLSVGELYLYNLRHVQHHVGQLQVRLRLAGVTPPRWVARGAPGEAGGGA